MFISTAYCTFKCDKEAGCQVCQNSDLANAPIIEISADELIDRFLSNDITEAVTFGGLEPFDQPEELYDFITKFRKQSDADIVIYTGYYLKELFFNLLPIRKYHNIIIKCGRFIPNRPHICDELLGVELASDNQKAYRLEDMFE